MRLKLETLADAEAVARRGAELIADAARAALAARGRFAFAASGGRTPWRTFELLAEAALPWERVHVFQTDERVAPAGDPERSWSSLEASLLARAPVPAANGHPMPVDAEPLEAGAAAYARELAAVCGAPPVLDLVHLGLGGDGHTASLLPGDAALEVADADVALAGPFRGYRRMTLTLPVLGRARAVLWIVTGREKSAALARLLAGDASIPAGRVRARAAHVLADRAAAADAALRA
jgi:6-phosphogluconolactonase